MKTLHIFHHSNLTNGVDRTTLTLLAALQRLGVSVHALVPESGDASQALDGLRVPYRLGALGCCTGPSRAAELAFLARAANRAQMIGDWLREEKFDLVHLNTGHLLDGAMAACKANVPALWHIHSPFEVDLERYARFMGPAAYAWMLADVGRHVVAVSEDVRASLLQWLPPEKVSVLYNGIDISDIDARAQQAITPLREELGLAIDTPIVLGVGRISAQKDFATFVRVAKRVADVHPHVCFAIAGPPEAADLAEALSRQIQELGLARRVFMLGPRNNVPALLAQCDAFLSTAIFEGQGLACIEAMAMRKPAVAMGCVGLRECIEHDRDGLLVPLGDEVACAQAVLRVLQDKPLAETLGENGRQTALHKYSAEAYAKGFLAIAEKVVEEPGRNKAASAEFVLGLLNEIREVGEQAARLGQPKLLRTRLKARLFRWAGLN